MKIITLHTFKSKLIKIKPVSISDQNSHHIWSHYHAAFTEHKYWAVNKALYFIPHLSAQNLLIYCCLPCCVLFFYVLLSCFMVLLTNKISCHKIIFISVVIVSRMINYVKYREMRNIFLQTCLTIKYLVQIKIKK